MLEDIKINDPAQIKSTEIDDCDNVLQALRTQKENGNIEKAYQLGAILAAEVENNDGEFIFGLDANDESSYNIILQRRLLLAFTVDFGISLYCENFFVAKTTSTCFFNTIKENSPHIYDVIRENGAFSYYYLCLRDSENVEKSIGQQFAKLINKKDDQVYEKLGMALYFYFLDFIKEKVKSLDFKD